MAKGLMTDDISAIRIWMTWWCGISNRWHNRWIHMCTVVAKYGVRDWWFYWLTLSTLQTWYFVKRSLSPIFSVYFRKLLGTPTVVSICQVTDGCWIWSDLEGSVLNLNEVLSQHLYGGTEEDDEDLRAGRNSNQVSPEYKSFGTCLWLSSVFNDVSQSKQFT